MLGYWMRKVELVLKMRTLADALAAMREWLDHNDCVPLDFGIEREDAFSLPV